MKSTKYIRPYIDNKISIPGLKIKGKKGIYFIYEIRSKEIIYIGKSNSNLYKTLTRHFQRWNDRKQERFVYKKTGYLVKVIYTDSAKQTDTLEALYILKLKPRDNRDTKLKLFADSEYIKNLKQAEKKAEIIEDVPF